MATDTDTSTSWLGQYVEQVVSAGAARWVLSVLTATGTMSGTIGAWDTVDVLGVDEASAPEPPTRRSWTRRASGVSHASYRHIFVGGCGRAAGVGRRRAAGGGGGGGEADVVLRCPRRRRCSPWSPSRGARVWRRGRFRRRRRQQVGGINRGERGDVVALSDGVGGGRNYWIETAAAMLCFGWEKRESIRAVRGRGLGETSRLGNFNCNGLGRVSLRFKDRCAAPALQLQWPINHRMQFRKDERSAVALPFFLLFFFFFLN